jgi:hypothetical protein
MNSPHQKAASQNGVAAVTGATVSYQRHGFKINSLFLLGAAALTSTASSGCASAQTVKPMAPTASNSAKPAAPTAADIAGPDGVVYPDFSRVGVPGGIPNVPSKARAEDFGAVANDDRDDSAAVQKAVDSLGETGGAVSLSAGTFVFDDTVRVAKNGIVIRGVGAGKTIVVPRFAAQKLDNPSQGAPRAATFLFEGVTHPKRVRADLTAPLKRGDTTVRVGDSSGFLPGEQLIISCRAVPSDVMQTLSPKLRAQVEEPAAKAKAAGYNHPQWRMNAALIVSQKDGVITLDRPLRADLPLDLEPFADMNYQSLRGCGLEGLSIKQEVQKPQIEGVRFTRTSGCWVGDIEVRNIGNGPIAFERSVAFEMRDCAFDEFQEEKTNSRGGGVGYAAFDTAFEGLIENCRFERLRHLSVSNFSTGNVFLKCVLRNADINFHLNWPSETLFDNCDVQASAAEGERNRGSYDQGVYTPRHHGDIHLPSGPGHVFYANRISSKKDSVHLGGGGSSRNIFAYNQFVSESGKAVILKRGSHDNLFLKNVFSLGNYAWKRDDWALQFATGAFDKVDPLLSDEPAAVLFPGGEARGNRFVGNRFFGVPADKLFVGAGKLAEDADNIASKDYAVPEPPQPPVPSLYLWQKQQNSRAAR